MIYYPTWWLLGPFGWLKECFGDNQYKIWICKKHIHSHHFVTTLKCSNRCSNRSFRLVNFKDLHSDFFLFDGFGTALNKSYFHHSYNP